MTLATKNVSDRLASYLELSPAFRRVLGGFSHRGRGFWMVLKVSLVQSSRLSRFYFAFENKIQNALEVKQASALDLARLADADAAEVPLLRPLVKFGPT